MKIPSPSSFTGLTFLASVSLCWIGATSLVVAQNGSGGDYEGPVGVTGIFNGNVTTGCSYDPLTHSARRVIDDIIVPGSVGKYPLKMTRYYNSRAQYYANSLGHGWEHEYGWLLSAAGARLLSPSGSLYDPRCEEPVGVSEGWEQRTDAYNGTWRLADGGKVVFTNGRAASIIDPYGQTTTITRDPTTSEISRVTEPGGRYLKFIYGALETSYGASFPLLTRVEAYDGPAGHLIDWVNYSYTLVSPGGSGQSMKMLTGVSYSDGTSAAYTYRTDNVTESPSSPPYNPSSPGELQ